MGLTLSASFTPAKGSVSLNAPMLTAVMIVVGLPCLSFWVTFGAIIGRTLRSNRAWQLFNRIMGGLTAACGLLILLD